MTSKKDFIEKLAEMFIDAWCLAQSGDQLVIEDGEDPMDLPYVSAFVETLDALGYELSYDCEEECFWLLPDADDPYFDGPVPFYY